MKRIFFGSLAACAFLFSSCANEYVSATPGFYAPTLPTDPAASFGLFIQQTPPAMIEVLSEK